MPGGVSVLSVRGIHGQPGEVVERGGQQFGLEHACEAYDGRGFGGNVVHGGAWWRVFEAAGVERLALVPGLERLGPVFADVGEYGVF